MSVTAIPEDEDIAVARLRPRIAEEDGDSPFTNDELLEYLGASDSLEEAAVKVWTIKAGKYAELVDVNEAGGSRNLSQLHKNALLMVKFYQDQIDASQVMVEVLEPGSSGYAQTYRITR